MKPTGSESLEVKAGSAQGGGHESNTDEGIKSAEFGRDSKPPGAGFEL
jgi:hypothetical protein